MKAIFFKYIAIILAILSFNIHKLSAQNIFTFPDTVCVNETVNLQNISSNGAYYSWNFCIPNINNNPTAVSIGNPGGMMNVNVFSDIVIDHTTGNYHMFFTNYNARNVVRLDFGNSPLNVPTATNLGTFGGLLPPQLEGIQIAKDGNNWYGFVVGGQAVADAKVVRLDFGNNLTNAPTATNLGNIGNMAWPTEYQLVNDGGNWFGIVANRSNSRISVHNYGNSLANAPTGTNFQITGVGNSPCNLMAIKDGNNWHVFVTLLYNAFVRLDYGNSLTNVPTMTNFGTLSGSLQALPRGIVILKDCNQYVGYLGHENGNTLKLNFNSGITGTPTVTNLNNISGVYQKVHEFSPITFNGNLYMFTADYATNTMQRMQINLCNGTPASSNNFNPPAYSYGTPGIYDVTLIVDEGRGIPQVQCSKIVVLDKYTDTIIDSICLGNTYTLPGGAIVNTTGIYNDTLPTIGGCDSVITTFLTVLNPIPTIVSTNVTCNGLNNGTATATTTGGANPYSYSWTTNPAQTNATANNLSPNTYTVTVTDGKGCTGTASVTISEPTALTATINGSTNVSCFGGNNGTAGVTASGGTAPYSYNWNSSPAQNTANASGLTAGSYTVIVTDANNCTATTTVTITQPSPFTATISSFTNVSCFAGNNGAATVVGNGGSTPYSYTWSTTPVQTNDSVTNLTAGTYTVIITDANNCTATTTVTITQPSMVNVNITSNNAKCNGACDGNATANGTGGTAPYTYSWSTTPAQTTSIATNLCAGTYTVIITDNNGCTNSSAVSINQPSLLTSNISSSNNVRCNGGNSGSASVTANGGTSPYSYLWSSSSSQNTSTATNLTAGSYTVTVTDANGCTSTSAVTLTEPSAIVATTNAILGPCDRNNTANVTVSGGTPGYTYSWNTSPIQTTATATNVPAGNYIVTITDANGCTKTQTLAIINPMITPTPSFSVNPTSASILEDPEFHFYDNSANANIWSWDFGDGDSSSLQNPTHIYADTGTYCITLTVTNLPSQCKDSTTKCIRVEGDWTFYIPNAFTPNADGKNDLFMGKGYGIKKFQMQIFDRWGNMIFESNDINKGWDGKANGGSELAQIDTYVYKVNLIDVKGKERQFIGHFSMVK